MVLDVKCNRRLGDLPGHGPGDRDVRPVSRGFRGQALPLSVAQPASGLLKG